MLIMAVVSAGRSLLLLAAQWSQILNMFVSQHLVDVKRTWTLSLIVVDKRKVMYYCSEKDLKF
jgi:hypothetical protein